MTSPARFPDLNPIENVGDKLARHFHAECTQFHAVDELRKVIKRAANTVSKAYLRKLVRYITDRYTEVIEKEGRYNGF